MHIDFKRSAQRCTVNSVGAGSHFSCQVCLALLVLLWSVSGCNESSPSNTDSRLTPANASPGTTAGAGDETTGDETTGDETTGDNPPPAQTENSSDGAPESTQSASTEAPATRQTTDSSGKQPGEANGSTGSNTPTESDAEAQVRAALKDAVQLLEQKNYIRFMNYYFPTGQLRQVRKSTGYARAIFQLVRTPQTVQRWHRLLQAGVNAKIVLHPRGYEARIEVEVKPTAVPDQDAAPPTPELPQIEIVGFGSELKPALDSAIQALESKDYHTLVSHMFPISQLQRMPSLDDASPIMSRLKSRPEMSAAMLSDFKLMRDQKPGMSADKSVATFRIPGTKVQLTADRNITTPARTVRLQKIGEHWRLFDSTTAYHQQIAQQDSNAPTDLRATLVLEKFGDQWRLQELP